MPKRGGFLEIDLRALSELVDKLLWCHIQAKMMDELPAVLERLRDNIDDVAWQRKIVYFQALHALLPDWDRVAGRRELKKLEPIADETDVEILQLYLDLFAEELTFSEEQDLVDHILALTDKFSDRLHYKGTKAFLYFSIGDQKRAKSELDEVITEAREKQNKSDLSRYERYRFAMALDFLGELRQDNDLLTQALNLYQDLLKSDDLKPSGKAHLWRQIGETHRHMADWENARISFVRAIEIEPLPIYKVFLGDSLVQLGDITAAAKTLDEVEFGDMSGYEQADYAFSLAVLAIEMSETDRLENAKQILNSVAVKEPHFREQRAQFLLNVQEALVSGPSQTLQKRSRKLFGNIRRYLILQPNFMGVGIDVGKVFEDFPKNGETSEQD